MKNKKRTEFDTLGSKKIDNKNFWGAQTQRSLENFKIGCEKIPIEIIKALGLQKKAACKTNMQFNLIDKRIGSAIIKACDKIINQELKDQFPLSVWQTGSGTQTNMNVNEVISNIAIKSLKGKIGSKKPVHPNDHVNLSQSSNDTFPTVMHIAINELTDEKLIPSLNDLIKELRSGWRAFWFNNTAKVFDISLKKEFSPIDEKEDYLIEDILQRAFQNEQLERQRPGFEIDFYACVNKWGKPKTKK